MTSFIRRWFWIWLALTIVYPTTFLSVTEDNLWASPVGEWVWIHIGQLSHWEWVLLGIPITLILSALFAAWDVIWMSLIVAAALLPFTVTKPKHNRFSSLDCLDAPRDLVWKVISDVASWPEWNPEIMKVQKTGESEGKQFWRIYMKHQRQDQEWFFDSVLSLSPPDYLYAEMKTNIGFELSLHEEIKLLEDGNATVMEKTAESHIKGASKIVALFDWKGRGLKKAHQRYIEKLRHYLAKLREK